MAISGIILFAYVDGFESANTVGVVLSVGAALGAAFYKVCSYNGMVTGLWEEILAP